MPVFDSGKGLFSWLAVTSGFFFSLPGLTFPLEECQSMCNPIPLFTPCWKSYTSARYIRDMAFGNSLIFFPWLFFLASRSCSFLARLHWTFHMFGRGSNSRCSHDRILGQICRVLLEVRQIVRRVKFDSLPLTRLGSFLASICQRDNDRDVALFSLLAGCPSHDTCADAIFAQLGPSGLVKFLFCYFR